MRPAGGDWTSGTVVARPRPSCARSSFIRGGNPLGAQLYENQCFYQEITTHLRFLLTATHKLCVLCFPHVLRLRHVLSFFSRRQKGRVLEQEFRADSESVLKSCSRPVVQKLGGGDFPAESAARGRPLEPIWGASAPWSPGVFLDEKPATADLSSCLLYTSPSPRD